MTKSSKNQYLARTGLLVLQHTITFALAYTNRFRKFPFKHADGYNMHSHCNEMIKLHVDAKGEDAILEAIEQINDLLKAYLKRFKNFKFVIRDDHGRTCDVYTHASEIVKNNETWLAAHKEKSTKKKSR